MGTPPQNQSAAVPGASLREWTGPRYLALTVLGAAVTAMALAIPTAIVSNPLFARMTPVEPEQYIFWILTSLLVGALVATYLEPGLRRGVAGTSAGAGLLGVFAVGCPVCNKLVLATIGSSGALTYFAPIQPVLGAAAVGLAGYALWARMRAIRSGACRLPATAKSSAGAGSGERAAAP